MGLFDALKVMMGGKHPAETPSGGDMVTPAPIDPVTTAAVMPADGSLPPQPAAPAADGLGSTPAGDGDATVGPDATVPAAPAPASPAGSPAPTQSAPTDPSKPA